MKGPKGMPQLKEISAAQLKCIVEAALLAADEPLDHNRLAALFDDGERPALADIVRALEALGEDCAQHGNHKVGTVVTISQKNVSRIELIDELSE